MRTLILAGAALVAAQTMAAEDALPFMIQRYRAPQNYAPGVWEATVEELAKHPGCADEVWFSTGVGFPPVAWHVAQAERLKRHSQDLRRLGIRPSLEFQAIFGHGDSVVRGRKADISGKTWTGWTLESGTETKACNCPRNPDFRTYVSKIAAIYGACGFDSVWLDDDFRIGWHQPVPAEKTMSGCFCARCVADFAQRENRGFTRATLVAALKADAKLLDRWEAYTYDSLAEVAELIARTVHAHSPRTRFGFQHGYFDRPYQLKIYDALVRHSDGFGVGSRPGGGAYFDHNPFDILGKIQDGGLQMSVLGLPNEKVTLVCPEIENCPRNFYTKTARGVIFEALMNLAQGMNALSFFLVDPTDESQRWYGDTYYAPLAEAAPKLRAYCDLNRGTLPGGIRLKAGVPPALAAVGIPMTTAPAYACVEGLDALGLSPEDLNMGWGKSSAAIRKIADAADRVSGGKMPVRFLGPVKAMVTPRVTAAGELRSVALVNASIDVQPPVKLALRGLPAGTKTLCWTPLTGSLGADPAKLPVCTEGEETYVTLPAVDAWACGYLAPVDVK